MYIWPCGSIYVRCRIFFFSCNSSGLGNRFFGLMFLQNLNCLMQFHNHMKHIRKNIDSNLFHCNELLLRDLVLELSVVKFPSDPHCSPVSTLETGRCLSLTTNVLTFYFFFSHYPHFRCKSPLSGCASTFFLPSVPDLRYLCPFYCPSAS